MNQTKTEFQRICIELESALEEYKNRYPKNLGQIIRCEIGRITVLMALFLCAVSFLSLTPNYTMFAFIAAIGGRFYLFAVPIESNDEDIDTTKFKPRAKDFGSRVSESVEAYKSLSAYDKKGIAKIEDAMAQLETFAEYPDVEKYCKGFTRQVNEVTKMKRAVREKYDKFTKYSLWTAGIILAILLVNAIILCNTINLN